MRMEKKVLALAVLMATLYVPQARAANIEMEPGQHAYDITVNGAPHRPGPTNTQLNTIAYDNSTATTSLAFSSTEVTTRTYGDELNLTATGILSQMKFSIFNSGSSAGTLTGATVLINIYDAVTSANLGSFSSSVTFSTALSAGFYSVVTATNLDPLGINVNTTNVLVTQRITAKTGAASRTGIVSLSPPSVGSSPAYFYQSSGTVAAGFYTSASGAVNPVYQLSLAPPPVSARSTSWSRVKNLYR
jgi:hypothetical protein